MHLRMARAFSHLEEQCEGPAVQVVQSLEDGVREGVLLGQSLDDGDEVFHLRVGGGRGCCMGGEGITGVGLRE